MASMYQPPIVGRHEFTGYDSDLSLVPETMCEDQSETMLSEISEISGISNATRRNQPSPPTIQEEARRKGKGWSSTFPDKWPRLNTTMQSKELIGILKTMISYHCGNSRVRPTLFPKPSWYDEELYPWAGSSFLGKDPRPKHEINKIPKMVAVKTIIAAGYRHHGLHDKVPKVWTPIS